MKITLLKPLLDDVFLLDTVTLILYSSSKSIPISIPIDHLKICRQNNVNGLEISDSLYSSVDSIKYDVLFKNGIMQEFDFPNKVDALFTAPKIKREIPHIKINTKTPYANTDEDKAIIIAKLLEDVKAIYDTPDAVFGTKNLIYYSVFGRGYADLFKTSLNTIKNNSVINFDVLIITDEKTKQYLNTINIPEEFSINYFVMDTPVDGIESSMTKTRIFEWDFVDEYNKILFLDCDIICVNDIGVVFENIVDTDKLYTIYNPTVNTGSFLTLYHGLKYRAQDIKDKADLKGYRPFNCGQFAFINSAYLHNHFKNMNYVMSIWSGEYFFEQSFMNCYAVIADVIDQSINDYFVIANATLVNPVKVHDNDDVFVHFTAPALNSDIKIKYIDDYMTAFI